jgi:pimeloyl-ACP methyl ester carboxylesterase
MGVSSRCWFDLPARLATHEPSYRVVTMDTRGAGQSDKPMGLYRMAELADDVRRVMDAAGLDQAYVAGLSLGGMIAQELALQSPDRVRGLLLVSTTPGMPHGAWPRREAVATLLSVPFYDRSKPAEPLFRLIFSHKDAPRGEELLAGWEDAIHEEPIDPIGFFGQVTAAIGHSTGSRLHGIRCPTVILAGDEDVLTPVEGSRYMAEQIPGAVLHVLTEMGHGIPMADPQAMERGLDELVALRER